MSKLVWSPVIKKIEELAGTNGSITGCVSAFVTIDAIEVLSQYFCRERCFLITRWRVPELATGVSDIEVYSLLRSLDIPMYISYKLHSKLYRFADGNVLCGSCNATGNGLGLTETANIETSCVVSNLDLDDEIQLKTLFDSSIRVTDQLYEEFKQAIQDCPPAPPYTTLELEIYRRHGQSKDFLLSDLPASKEPEILIASVLHSSNSSQLNETEVADCINFQLVAAGKDKIAENLSINFCNSPFVKAIVAEIREQGSMNFGAVTSFVHDRCRDVPIPYRSTVKERVNTLYNWLCYFFDDLTWDVPGARSQVIRSNLKD